MQKIQTAADEENKSFRVVLSDYDGPLDLLLDMVKRAKIRIEDIFISDITEQYLKAMEGLEQLDMEQAADFIDVAATLLEIKSRALLPRPESVELPPEEDPKVDLINRLEEYRLFKEASEKMRTREVINMFSRAPDESVGQPRLVLKDMTTDGLVKALRKMFEKLGTRQQVFKQRKIDLDPFTVADKMQYITARVSSAERVTFDELFGEDFTLNEIVTTFMALLELLKNQVVCAEQNEIFDTITITKRRAEEQ
ncbi:MAG: segregation/condensation protein A [Clostridia bacterium]|jgi:segregation and condensation protein A|nr:segregation/condensation protein A [Clostridia bacterium]MCI9460064.1 segregation/condensation protein A [Clostridia bacterium]